MTPVTLTLEERIVAALAGYVFAWLEFDTLVRTQAERILNDLDVVRRDEFEAAKEMARLAREENEALKARPVERSGACDVL